ncbi:hypothetical protein [Psychroserpens algicola]|uniref:hypothetical protein n=1 Tax=Psychroserpens algicola TaxID=1719034 RepID=UPI001952BF0E|nr:hypothetical protein [Psychroserpens algicola]
MKTFYRSSVILLLIVIAVFSCEKKKKQTFDNLFKKHIISEQQGIDMFHEFHNSRTNLIEPILQNHYNDSTFQDTKFVWVSLDDMKTYIHFVETIQKENPTKDVSGLRLYFAAYPNSNEFNGKRIKHPRQQTFFMIPTVKNKRSTEKNVNLNHLPFVIESKGDNVLKGSFKIVEELMLDYDKKLRLDTYNKTDINLESSFGARSLLAQESNKTTISTIFNEGEMSPPPNN